MTTEPTETPAAEMAEPEIEPSLTTKIVIIEGERFSVPSDMPVEQIRENLASTYPGVRTARVDTGTIDIEGTRYATIEFTKQAGTKGQSWEPLGHPLAPLLHLPRVRTGPVPDWHSTRLLRRGAFTFGEALGMEFFRESRWSRSSPYLLGVNLCQRLEDLPAVAAGPDLPVPGWSA